MNSSITRRMLSRRLRRFNNLTFMQFTALLQFVTQVICKRITLRDPVSVCDTYKGAYSESRDCPEDANAQQFYDCVRDAFSFDEWMGKIAVQMMKQLCEDLVAFKNHGLTCTSTIFWQSEPCELQASAIRFPLVGDWGGTEFLMSKLDQYAEGAHDDKMESGGSEFSRMLLRLNDKLNFNFIVNTGNNIYPNGVESAETRDEQFWAVFRDFGNLAPVWYSSLGNRDHVTKGSKEQEIEYTRHDPTGRWILPWSFYSFTYKLVDSAKRDPDTLVYFIVTDTVTICGLQTSGARRMEEGTPELKHSEDHIAWLDRELGSETAQSADYLFVVGHYPPFSIRKMADNWKCMLKYFGPSKLADKFGVSAYFSGNQHLLQHFKKMGKRTKRRIDYVVSGEGSNVYPINKEDRADGRYINDFYHGYYHLEQKRRDVKPGLIHVEVRNDNATFHFVDAAGKQLSEPITLPRRQKNQQNPDRTEL